MKSIVASRPCPHWTLAVLASGLILCQTARAAVTFTVSPTTVSNTYPGSIRLQVAGLAGGDTVLVQWYLDANANGAIDSNDWLAQQCQLTDGQPGMVVGGVTNLNVPGDLDATAGAITATLNFVNGSFAPRVVGGSWFRLSSPAGRFSPITVPFTVVADPYPQRVSGTVLNNGTPVPYATVLLFPMAAGQTKPQGPPTAGMLANGAGSFSLPAPVGTYVVMAFKSGYLLNFSASSPVTVSAGATVSANPSLLAAGGSVSGKVVDAGNNSLGLGGVLVSAQATSGLMGIGFTDSNGNFTVNVQAGQWALRADNTTLLSLGYVGLRNGVTVSAGTSGVMLAVPKATALAYGRVRDNVGNPLAGVDVYASDDPGSDLYQSDGYSDANGNYAVGLVGGTNAWWISVENGPADYLFSSSSILSPASGQAVLANFSALPATSQITGTLKDGNNNPIGGVGLWASHTENDVNYQSNTTTDNSGRYSLKVANGTWYLGISTCTDCNDGLPANYIAPANPAVSVANNSPVVNLVAIAVTAHLSGLVQDSNGNPIRGVQVYAEATLNGTLYQAWADTDSTGHYTLNVANGSWSAHVNCNYGGDSLDHVLGAGNYVCPNNQSVSVNNNNPTVNFTVQLCSGVQITTTTLPDGEVNSPYETWLAASSCGGNLNWSLSSGSSLPAGLNLAGNGQLYGTPSAAGTYSFSVHVDDGSGHSADATLSVHIVPSATPLQITTGWLPAATNGVLYSQVLQATGGQTPYTWSLAPYSAGLPAGLSLATNGTLSGTPATNGTFNFFARVTDAANATADQALSLSIVKPPLQITTTSLPDGTVGIGYTHQLAATGGSGSCWWQLVNGSAPLPANLTLDSSGLISGLPTTAGAFQFLVQASDGSSSPSKALAIVIHSAPVLSAPAWSTSGFQMLLTGSPGVSYTLQTSTNLGSTNWTALYATNNPLTNSFLLIDPNPTGPGDRFYRVQSGP